jgi:hypothetical protein
MEDRSDGHFALVILRSRPSNSRQVADLTPCSPSAGARCSNPQCPSLALRCNVRVVVDRLLAGAALT